MYEISIGHAHYTHAQNQFQSDTVTHGKCQDEEVSGFPLTAGGCDSQALTVFPETEQPWKVPY